MTRVVAIRPEPGLSATLAAGRALGLDMAGWPLFEFRTLGWVPPDPATVDALLTGSANAIRLGGPGIEAFRGKPVHAVGEATAEAAREAGFAVASVGEGGLQKLLGTLATKPRRLLRLAGVEHVPLVAPEGIAIETRIVYRSEPLPMPADMAAMLRNGGLAMLHSAVAARHFAGECDRFGIDRWRISLAALAPRIAEAAGEGWAQVCAAERPREAALLALAQHMCH